MTSKTRAPLDQRADFRLAVRLAFVSSFPHHVSRWRRARRELDKLLTRASRAGFFDDVTRNPLIVAEQIERRFLRRTEARAPRPGRAPHAEPTSHPPGASLPPNPTPRDEQA